MARKKSVEQLTFRHELAAAHLALGASVQEAANRAGVGRRTLTRWIGESWFQELRAAVESQTREEIVEATRGAAIVDRANRVARRNQRWLEIAHRIEDLSERQGRPGGLSKTETAELEALRKEERENEKQAAIELGEWQEKLKLENLTDAELHRLMEVAVSKGREAG